ncbi:MAG: formate dehydrogenase [Deltaproteobacteria bacterium]|nr:formate dehydrogenase [Deltaproteobacteria bacterium]
MSKSFFIDTTQCMGCRGCQVACKQWHGLPAEETTNRGTYENPPDLSFDTYKLVRMREEVLNKKLKWIFFQEQCRHCVEAPCLETAGMPSAIFKDAATNAIIYTANTKDLDAGEIIESCPYNIPRKAADGTLAKCDMCNDRVQNGLLPACVKTCATNAMNFGDRADMLALANKRAKMVKNAKLLDADSVNVIYLVDFDPALVHGNVVASNSGVGITRQAALKKMFRPLTSAASQLL